MAKPGNHESLWSTGRAPSPATTTRSPGPSGPAAHRRPIRRSSSGWWQAVLGSRHARRTSSGSTPAAPATSARVLEPRPLSTTTSASLDPRGRGRAVRRPRAPVSPSWSRSSRPRGRHRAPGADDGVTAAQSTDRPSRSSARSSRSSSDWSSAATVRFSYVVVHEAERKPRPVWRRSPGPEVADPVAQDGTGPRSASSADLRPIHRGHVECRRRARRTRPRPDAGGGQRAWQKQTGR